MDCEQMEEFVNSRAKETAPEHIASGTFGIAFSALVGIELEQKGVHGAGEEAVPTHGDGSQQR